MSPHVLHSPSNRYKQNKNYKCSALHTLHVCAHHQIYHCTVTNAAEDDMFAVLLAVHLPGNSPQGTNYPGQHPPHTTTTPLWLSQCPLVQCAVVKSKCTVNYLQCMICSVQQVSYVQPLLSIMPPRVHLCSFLCVVRNFE